MPRGKNKQKKLERSFRHISNGTQQRNKGKRKSRQPERDEETTETPPDERLIEEHKTMAADQELSPSSAAVAMASTSREADEAAENGLLGACANPPSPSQKRAQEDQGPVTRCKQQRIQGNLEQFTPTPFHVDRTFEINDARVENWDVKEHIPESIRAHMEKHMIGSIDDKHSYFLPEITLNCQEEMLLATARSPDKICMDANSKKLWYFYREYQEVIGMSGKCPIREECHWVKVIMKKNGHMKSAYPVTIEGTYGAEITMRHFQKND